MNKTPAGSSNRWSWLARTALVALVVLVSGALVFPLIQAPFQTQNLMSNLSMSSTVAYSDSFFVSRLSYLWSAPKRGDVVVYGVERDGATRRYVSRIVGMPGDRIQMRASVLHINGKAVGKQPVKPPPGSMPGAERLYENNYIETLPNGVSYEIYDYSTTVPLDNTEVYRVPDGHYFMIGDNRDNSDDSRDPGRVGYVPLDHIVGKANYIFDAIDRSRVGRLIR